MDELALADWFMMAGHAFILTLGLVLGIYTIMARCVWMKSTMIIPRIGTISLISSSLSPRTDLVMLVLGSFMIIVFMGELLAL
jgi:hypothetical protein